MTQPTHVHTFEESGLGVSPFRLVRVERRVYQACAGAPIQPGACCDYCGTGIMECCVIRDSKGKEFTVGNECVRKTDDAGLINVTKRAVNRLRTEARHKAEAIRIAAAKQRLASEPVRASLASQPHPFAVSGETFWTSKTLLDWSDYMMAHAGNAGCMKVVRLLDKTA